MIRVDAARVAAAREEPAHDDDPSAERGGGDLGARLRHRARREPGADGDGRDAGGRHGASYPSQATSRIASAASDASATVTTFAIRSRRSVTAESPDDPAAAPFSGVLPTDSPSRAMM